MRVDHAVFRKYLAGEFSAENLIFWTACKDLKSVTNREIFKERVEKIFQNHLDTSSQYEVKFIFILYEACHPILILFLIERSCTYFALRRDTN